MKKRFKVIATAAVAVGVVGLASTALAQETGSREADRGAGLTSAVGAAQQGCQNVATGSRAGMPTPESFQTGVADACAQLGQ